MIVESAAVPGATTGATGSLEADAGVTDTALESRVEKPEVLEEQMALPEALEGMRGNEVVVMEEEDTTREVRRLESTLSMAMKQIKRQLIKRMEPLAKENAKLKEAMKLIEKNVQRAQHERDLSESNMRDLEYQNGALSKQLVIMSEQLYEQDAELSQLCQVIGQLQVEEKKASRQVEKLAEVLKGARFARGTSATNQQELEDEVEDVVKRLPKDVNLFDEVDGEGQTL
ncbi:uncharacterized protein [Miscanthus floridulus]|uniref:uncharacterized protein n=1 Tax=Miscanthus floridulus TaxID=154761 RepID=UPI003458B7D7